MRLIVIAVIFACLLATTARAQTGQIDRMRACAGISSALERLDCYDTAMKAAPSVPARPATAQVPQFRDFPVLSRPPARNAPLVLTQTDMTFRTRLREAATQRPNFAGAYIVATWGCGTECLMGAVINANTGRVTFLPASICCVSAAGDEYTDKIAFRLDSTLLILTGLRNEAENDLGAHFYRIEGDQLIHVRDMPLSKKQ